MNFSLVYIVIITICFTHITTSLIFDMAQISPHNHNKDIVTDGPETYISTDGIQLASQEDIPSQDAVGRATYVKLLHLWDTVSGQIVDFTTNFTFSISSNDATDYGDGLSFFLARNSSLETAKGTLELPVIINASNAHMMASSQFVAVEFDTYWNKVGININSLGNITNNKECVVSIVYDSALQNLSVTVIDLFNDTIIPNQSELHYAVDLRRELPEWVVFGFRSLSSRDSFRENVVIKSWFFNSSDLQVDQIRWRKDKKKRKIVWVGSGSVIALLVVLFVVFVCVYFWNKKPNNDHIDQIVRKDPEITLESNYHPRAFLFKELSQATNNFNEEKKLGEGGFGAVYKGVLRNGLQVAVKRVSTTSKQGIKEYKAEVEIISKARHRHLVQLIGWCHEIEGELLVVYELLENRSLDGHLFKSESSLPWNVRYNIARGLAMSLRYLHEECVQCILHRDIKSSNVMLDSEFNPKLGDFGLAKLVDHDKLPDTTILAGTLGYLAPECLSSGKVSRESDVYSYGVVALEIAAGRKCTDPNAQENQRSLVNWVRELYRNDKNRILEAVDSKLGDSYDKKQMKGLITLGLWCVHPDPDERPSIREVLCALNNVNDPLTDLHNKIPSSLVHKSPIPLQSLDLSPENSQNFESKEVSKPNLLVALWSGSTARAKSLLHLWHQLEIE